MPVYEYVCKTCGCGFEKLRPVSDMDAKAPCPDCGSESRRRLSVFISMTTVGGRSEPVSGGGGGCCGGGCGGGACSA
ncbi:MAG: zinc ribbon domain-containing protein [SAR202 cluster bacterium]|nr:zinc ribbon domain-containing protein [SAR202 cluster bacterium]